MSAASPLSATTPTMASDGTKRAALFIVDVQNDFLPPKGSLMVPGGLLVVPAITELLTDKLFNWDLVVASQDWHPEGHISFASAHPGKKAFWDQPTLKDARGFEYEQKLWPDHCVQGTRGAEISKDILPKLEKYGDKFKLSRKGWHQGVEAYSAFDGYITPGTAPEDCPTGVPPMQNRAMVQLLREHGITHVVIAGLATDYCVAHTALSALSGRFKVAIVNPAVQGLSSSDSNEVFDKVLALGGTVIGRRTASAVNTSEEWEDDLAAWLKK